MNLSAKLFFLRNRIVRERILYSPRRFRSTADRCRTVPSRASWSMSITAVFSMRCILSISSNISSFATASSPCIGSSRMRSLFLPHMALARSTLCFCPPDSSAYLFLARCVTPRRSIASVARLFSRLVTKKLRIPPRHPDSTTSLTLSGPCISSLCGT